MTLKSVWRLIVQTASNWAEINPPHLSAALAFYAMLSLAPLLVISVAIAGFVLGPQAASGQIVSNVQNVAGPEAARTIQTVIAHMTHLRSGIIATATGGLLLLFGASSLAGELRDSLNTVWRIRTPESGWKGMIRYRFFAFVLVLASGFGLLISLLASAFLVAAGKYFTAILPIPDFFLETVNFFVTLTGVTILFALLYRFVPDVNIQWSDVWIGAAVTSLLFTIGKFLIGLYLGRATVGSPYGAAGSLVIFMVWIYYSAQIFYLGAEFTRIFSERHGSRAHLRREAAPPAPGPQPRVA